MTYIYMCVRVTTFGLNNGFSPSMRQAIIWLDYWRIYPLPWASVHWLVQCTLECHWNTTVWPSVHWDTTGRPNEYLQGTLEHHWKNLVETAHTGMPLEKL